jgi:hypothetical protein
LWSTIVNKIWAAFVALLSHGERASRCVYYNAPDDHRVFRIRIDEHSAVSGLDDRVGCGVAERPGFERIRRRRRQIDAIRQVEHDRKAVL